MTKPIITTRAGKGSQLTWAELDSNFTNLDNATWNITDGTTTISNDLNSAITFVAGTNVSFVLNNTTKSLTINSIGTNTATVLQQTVKNITGATIAKGIPVYINGSTGTNATVAVASNALESKSSKTIGLLGEPINDNSTGIVITEGLLSGLNTNGSTVGDPVWLGVNGALIYGLVGKPVSPAHLVYIGVVIAAHSSAGAIYVKPQNGFELDELHNVLLTSLADNDLLVYESSTGLWKNKQLTSTQVTSALGYTPYHSGDPLGTPSSGNLTNCTFPTASTSTAGVVKVDGTTITILDGVISGQPSSATRYLVTNDSGVTILKGTPVIFKKAPDAYSSYPYVTVGGIGDMGSNEMVLGITEQDISHGFSGKITANGLISGIDTSFLSNGLVYLGSNSANKYMSNTITSTYRPMCIGEVLKSDSTTGSIYVNIVKGYLLNELGNVSYSSITNNDVLTYTNGSWINKVLPTASTTVSGMVKVDGTTITISNGVISSSGGGGSYTLPVATTTTLGGVKSDGTSIQIDQNGVISSTYTYSLPTASSSVLGGVKVDSSSITIANGVISATPYSLPTASTSVLGGVKVDGTTITITGGVISSVGSGTPTDTISPFLLMGA